MSLTILSSPRLRRSPLIALAFALCIGAASAQTSLFPDPNRSDGTDNSSTRRSDTSLDSTSSGSNQPRSSDDRGTDSATRTLGTRRNGSGSGSDTTFERDAEADLQILELQMAERARRKAPPGEFELYVRRLAGQGPETDERELVRRFGSELVTGSGIPGLSDRGANPLPPPDYLIGPGDELQLLLWGSANADLRLRVDRSGRIGIPRVGSVSVAGVHYADLPEVIRKRVAQVFRNFELSVTLGQLRGVRVYVAGFAAYPGAYNVTSLTTIVGALLRAGGPAAAGSFRDIQLKRGKEVVARFDLYDLLLRGDRSADQLVRSDDVIYVGPVGPQAALIGSVNKPAIFELKEGETIDELLHMAGGFNAVADRSRLGLERLQQRRDERITELALPAGLSQRPLGGDVVRAFSSVLAVLPVAQQNRRVLIEGEVLKPGEYVLPPGSTVTDALAAAGGLTQWAYVYGTEFNRESVRRTQQENYQRALRDLEADFARNTTTQRVVSADEAAAQTAREASTTRLVDRLRTLRPTGRVVLQVTPDSRELPALQLEDSDRIYVPARPTTVGVFGSVYNGGSYLWGEGRETTEFLQLAGGPTRTADTGSIFVIRANGTVVSGRQRRGFLGTGGGLGGVKAVAGDTIFVPDEIDRTTFTQDLKDWTQILYQFGLGVAAIKVLGR